MPLRNKIRLILWLAILILIGRSAESFAQMRETSQWIEKYSKTYDAFPDIVYAQYGDVQVKLDLYVPKKSGKPAPAFVFFHGGGWRKGTKDSINLSSVFFENGWVLVNVDYRLLGTALAPAAVTDTRCAFAWVVRNAAKYNIDVTKIVLSGSSAGGHLALITGMLPANSEADAECSRGIPLKAAAIVNQYGITDVREILSGENRRGFGVDWLGKQPDREKVAALVSPVMYVDGDIPPILTIHGDADPTVPYTQATVLHQKLENAKKVNELFTVAGGGHGKFSREQKAEVMAKIAQFLYKHAGLELKGKE